MELDGCLWHATAYSKLRAIIATGHIRADACSRYPKSFCRCNGGVCLFDFGPTAELVDGKFYEAQGWFGVQQDARVSIWLEIDRHKVCGCLWDAATAREKWHNPNHQKGKYGKFIHGVEACHIGDIPISSVTRALLIDRDDRNVFIACELKSGVLQRVDEFEAGLTPSLSDPNGIVELLQQGRTQIQKK